MTLIFAKNCTHISDLCKSSNLKVKTNNLSQTFIKRNVICPHT